MVEARKVFKSIVKVVPFSYYSKLNLARTYNDPKKRFKELRKLNYEKYDNPIYQIMLGHELEQLGHDDYAKQAYEKAKDNKYARCKLALIYLKQFEANKANDALEGIEANEENNNTLNCIHVTICLMQGKFEDAIHWLKKCNEHNWIQIGPYYFRTDELIVQINYDITQSSRYDKSKRDNAVKEIEQYAKQGLVNANIFLLHILEDEKRKNKITQELLKKVAFKEVRLETGQMLIEYFLNKDQKDNATTVFNQMFEEKRHEIIAPFIRGWYLIKKNEKQKAVDEFQAFIANVFSKNWKSKINNIEQIEPEINQSLPFYPQIIYSLYFLSIFSNSNRKSINKAFIVYLAIIKTKLNKPNIETLMKELNDTERAEKEEINEYVKKHLEEIKKADKDRISKNELSEICKKAIKYLTSNCTREIVDGEKIRKLCSMETVTKHINNKKVSGNMLRRAIERKLGMSPFMYVLQQRMNESRKMLIGSGDPKDVQDISEYFGYKDEKNFTEIFKNYSGGMTPRQYQRKYSKRK